MLPKDARIYPKAACTAYAIALGGPGYAGIFTGRIKQGELGAII